LRHEEILVHASGCAGKKKWIAGDRAAHLESILVGAVVTDVHREDVAAAGESWRGDSRIGGVSSLIRRFV